MEGKIIMSQKELGRIEVLQKIMDKKMSQVSGAKLLGISYRQTKRLIRRVREGGISTILHRSRGIPSKKKIKNSLKKRILTIYKEKYPDFGPTFALEKLQEDHGFSLSVETLRKLLIEEGLWNCRKARKKDLYLWRERKHFEGELIQMDGSHHRWLEARLEQAFCLMAYIDDATSQIYARFYEYEGVYPALDSFQRYVKKYGAPKSIYTDRHSTYKTTRKASIDEDLEGEASNTQFQQVMKHLEVKVIYARSPQAKGRVERLFKTLQDRLVKELRLKGISTIHEANMFLTKYLSVFNAKFSVSAQEKTKLYRNLERDFDYKWTICLRTKRRIAKNYTIRCFNRLFLIKNPYLALKGQMVMVKQALNGDLQFESKHRILSVKEITDKEVTLVQQAQKELARHFKKQPVFYKSKKSWLDRQYYGKKKIELVS
jgi:transposase